MGFLVYMGWDGVYGVGVYAFMGYDTSDCTVSDAKPGDFRANLKIISS